MLTGEHMDLFPEKITITLILFSLLPRTLAIPPSRSTSIILGGKDFFSFTEEAPATVRHSLINGTSARSLELRHKSSTSKLELVSYKKISTGFVSF